MILPIDGHTVAADVHLLGDAGPPVVFLHGVMTSLDLARDVFTAPDEESWIALSLPGHGPGRLAPATNVDERLVADLMERALQALLGDRPVILVGWSMGGFAALAIAIHHPHRAVAVATLAGFADGRSIRGPVRWLMWLARQPLGRPVVVACLQLAAAWPWLHRTMTGLLAASGHTVAQATTTAMHRAFCQHDAGTLADVLAALPAADISDRLHLIRPPVWVVAGETDATIPRSATKRLAGLIPAATLTLYPRAGHLFFSEWPDFPADLAAWRATLDHP